MRFEDFIERLEGARQSGDGVIARCPAHEDQTASLKVSPVDGRILLHCHAGCRTEDVVASLGLAMADLMPPREEAKTKTETAYRILLPSGDVVEHVRVESLGGKKTFYWRRNGSTGLCGMRVVDVPLYHVRQPGQTPSRVCICEGEKAAIAATQFGFDSYGTVCGAAACPSQSVLKPVCDGRDVVLWADADEPGRRHMDKIEKEISGMARSIARIEIGSDGDDAADYKGTHQELELLISAGKKRLTPIIRLSERIPQALESLKKYSAGDYRDRVPIGITRVDRALRGGMMPGAVYLIGAPPGHGKTSLLSQIGVLTARNRGPVLIVSPEMQAEELVEREIIHASGAPLHGRGPWLPPEARAFTERVHEESAVSMTMEDLPVFFYDEMAVTMADISKHAASIDGLRLVIVDYAQEVADRSSTARYLAVGEVGAEAISLGRKYHCPVLIASQVNVTKGEHGERDYSFRETKDLEQRAHCSMIFEIKRSDAVNEHGYHSVESAKIFARKNRSGPLFDIPVRYDPELFGISDLNLSVVATQPQAPRQERFSY